MSLTKSMKDMWMDEVERVGEDFAADRLTLEAATDRLVRIGLDRDEAETMLKEGTA